MSTASLSHRLSAFTSLLSGAKKDDLRSILCGSPYISRNFTVRFVSRGVTEFPRWRRLSSRPSPTVIPSRRRSISNDVRVRSSQNENNADLDPRGGGDKLVRVISKDAEVSVLSLVATEVVREAQQRHNTSPTACAALGRTLMGTLLLGALKGDAETVQVLFRGNGPLGNMTAISADEGYVKGFVVNPSCDPPLKDNGKLNVGLAVGSGVVSVVRNNRNWKQPYTGTVPIYSGEVAEDIAHYLVDSEQMNTALGLGIGFDKEVGIRFAGGYLVQVLPFCSEETLSKLEENILKMKPLSDSPSDLKASDIAESILDGIGVGDYNDTIIPRYGPCGVEELKPRMLRAVASMERAEIQEILDEQGAIEVKCEFCNELVEFKETDLQVLQS